MNIATKDPAMADSQMGELAARITGPVIGALSPEEEIEIIAFRAVAGIYNRKAGEIAQKKTGNEARSLPFAELKREAAEKILQNFGEEKKCPNQEASLFSEDGTANGSQEVNANAQTAARASTNYYAQLLGLDADAYEPDFIDASADLVKTVVKMNINQADKVELIRLALAEPDMVVEIMNEIYRENGMGLHVHDLIERLKKEEHKKAEEFAKTVGDVDIMQPAAIVSRGVSTEGYTDPALKGLGEIYECISHIKGIKVIDGIRNGVTGSTPYGINVHPDSTPGSIRLVKQTTADFRAERDYYG